MTRKKTASAMNSMSWIGSRPRRSMRKNIRMQDGRLIEADSETIVTNAMARANHE